MHAIDNEEASWVPIWQTKQFRPPHSCLHEDPVMFFLAICISPPDSCIIMVLVCVVLPGVVVEIPLI